MYGNDLYTHLLENGKDAQALNAQFSSLSASSKCQSGTNACINGAFAQCVDGAFVTTQCAGGLSCFALPLVNKAGTVRRSIAVTHNARLIPRFPSPSLVILRSMPSRELPQQVPQEGSQDKPLPLWCLAGSAVDGKCKVRRTHQYTSPFRQENVEYH